MQICTFKAGIVTVRVQAFGCSVVPALAGSSYRIRYTTLRVRDAYPGHVFCSSRAIYFVARSFRTCPTDLPNTGHSYQQRVN